MADKIVVRTYSELATYLDMFAKGKIELLIFEANEGLGKTTTITNILGKGNFLMLNTHITPLANYIALYNNVGLPVYFEDIDALFKNATSTSIFKQLTETKKVKTIQYNTTSKLLTVEPEFETTSKVIVSCNKLNANSPNMKAIVSRGIWLSFEPTYEEIFNKMKSIINNIDINLNEEQRKEVLDFINNNMAFANRLNLRHLIRGLSLYSYWLQNKAFDWKNALLQLMGINPKLREVITLIQSGKPVKEQVKAFSGSRPTFYRYKKRVSKYQPFSKTPASAGEVKTG